jgi:hypothetical protein
MRSGEHHDNLYTQDAPRLDAHEIFTRSWRCGHMMVAMAAADSHGRCIQITHPLPVPIPVACRAPPAQATAACDDALSTDSATIFVRVPAREHGPWSQGRVEHPEACEIDALRTAHLHIRNYHT